MPRERINKDSIVSFAIEPYLKKKLTELAIEKEMSTGAFIRKILKDWLKENLPIEDRVESP